MRFSSHPYRQRNSLMTCGLSCSNKCRRGSRCHMLKLSRSISMGDWTDSSFRKCSWTRYRRWRWSTRFKIVSSGLYRRKCSTCICSWSGASKIKRSGAPTASYLWFSSFHKSNSHRHYTYWMSANRICPMTISTFVSMLNRLVATASLSCLSSLLMPI